MGEKVIHHCSWARHIHWYGHHNKHTPSAIQGNSVSLILHSIFLTIKAPTIHLSTDCTLSAQFVSECYLPNWHTKYTLSYPEDGTQHMPSKCWQSYTKQHGNIRQQS